MQPHPWLSRPWRCWHELQYDRQWVEDLVGVGMGKIRGVARPLPLGWMTIEAWCDANRIGREDRVWLLFQVRAMDAVYVRHRNAKITAEIASFMRG